MQHNSKFKHALLLLFFLVSDSALSVTKTNGKDTLEYNNA